jgi:hypothetical protein
MKRLLWIPVFLLWTSGLLAQSIPPTQLARMSIMFITSGSAAGSSTTTTVGTPNCGAAGSGQGYGSLTGYSQNDIGGGYRVYAAKFTASTTCIANKIRMYGRYMATAANVKMEIQESSGSYLPLAYTASESAMGAADGWISGTLNTSITFTQGTAYLLTWVTDADAWFYQHTVSGQITYYQSYSDSVWTDWPFDGLPGSSYEANIAIEAYYE